MAERSESTLTLKKLRRPFAVLAVGLAVLPGCSNDESAESPQNSAMSSSETPLLPEFPKLPIFGPVAIPLGERVIMATTICESLSDTDPLYKTLKQSKAVIVDGRCDAAPEAPVGVYPEPTQELESIDQVVTEELLRAECLEGGQFIRNVQDQGSIMWVRVKSNNRSGYVPSIWVQGEESLKNC